MPKATNTNAASPMVQIDFSDLGTDDAVLSIREHAFLGYVNIRGSSDNIEFMSAVKKCLGRELPVSANSYVEIGDTTILWLSPDEWLVVTLESNAGVIERELREVLGDTFASVNDVSGGNTALEISGEKAQAILLKGCPLDLHHTVFSTGQCAQTVMAKTSIMLWQTDPAPIYRLIVRRSFSDYLGLWFLNAAKEYR